MKLDQNSNADGKGKYVAINMRKIPGSPTTVAELAAAILANPESVEFGHQGSPDEFFLMKLCDQCAPSGLIGYALDAKQFDEEYANQVLDLSRRAGVNSPFCKKPD